MSAVYTRDPDRILLNTNIGNVQAWRAMPADVAVCVSLYASVQHAPGAASYVSQTLNLTARDARNLARALTKAADYADKVRTDRVEDAA
jgi:uncharacterized protein YfaA (DUF2138 family)